jgi:hypothetical protein
VPDEAGPLLDVSVDYTVAPDAPRGEGHTPIPRPYVLLDVTGPNGWRPIRGLIDTGADTSILPVEYASILGYSSDALEPKTIRQVGGTTVDALRAALPCAAHIAGDPSRPFEIRPLFVRGAALVLWGRTDFMKAWDVCLHERESRCTLRYLAVATSDDALEVVERRPPRQSLE